MMENLKAFTDHMAENADIDPIIEKWLERVVELDIMMCNKVILLCKYFEKMPDDILPNYANLLLEALERCGPRNELLVSASFNQKLCDFAEIIAHKGDTEKATRLKDKIRCNKT